MSPVPIYQFARKGQSTHSEGIVLQVSGPGQSWIGNFQSGHYEGALTCIIGFRTQPSFCAFAGGQAYKVRLDSPTAYSVLTIFPIFGAHYIHEKDWLIVWDFTKLEAHSAKGLIWRSSRLSWDGVSIAEVRDGHIVGLAWDATQDCNVEFRVDLLTGNHTGGATDVPEL